MNILPHKWGKFCTTDTNTTEWRKSYSNGEIHADSAELCFCFWMSLQYRRDRCEIPAAAQRGVQRLKALHSEAFCVFAWRQVKLDVPRWEQICVNPHFASVASWFDFILLCRWGFFFFFLASRKSAALQLTRGSNAVNSLQAPRNHYACLELRKSFTKNLRGRKPAAGSHVVHQRTPTLRPFLSRLHQNTPSLPQEVGNWTPSTAVTLFSHSLAWGSSFSCWVMGVKSLTVTITQQVTVATCCCESWLRDNWSPAKTLVAATGGPESN